MAKSGNSKQQDLHRRLGQGANAKANAREEMLKELADPERFAHHLRVFGHMALLLEPMHPCRFPADPFIDAVIAAELPDVPEGEDPAIVRGLALRAAVIPGLANQELLERCQAAIQASIGTVDQREPIMALTAGGAMASACLQGGVPTEHPFWDILFELTLSESLLSSQFLTRLVHGRLSVDQEAIAKVFAKELSQGELGSEIAELGLDETDANAIAARYVTLVADRDPHHFQYDAVLNLSALHVELAERLGKQIATEGLTAELLEETQARVAEAFTADVSHGLIDEISGWYRRHLEALRDNPEAFEGKLPRPIDQERDRCLISYLAMKALPEDQNPLLRAIHVQSLARSRVGVAPEEAPFVARLWSNPTDPFALEEYEKYLLAKGDKSRSRRVRRFREADHQARVKAKQEAAKAEEAAKADEATDPAE